MAVSTASYAARVTDSSARISDTIGDITSHSTAVYFVAKHQTDAGAPKIRVTGTVSDAATGSVYVDLDVLASSPKWRTGVYDAAWEVEDASGDLWTLPALGGKTLEILEALK